MHIFHHIAMGKTVYIKKNQHKIPYITFPEDDAAQRWFIEIFLKNSQVNKYAD